MTSTTISRSSARLAAFAARAAITAGGLLLLPLDRGGAQAAGDARADLPDAVVRALTLAAGYVAEGESLEDDGRIVASGTEGRIEERSLSVFDVVYVPPEFDGRRAAAGDSLLVYEDGGTLSDPASHRALGRIVVPTGLAIVTAAEGDVVSAVLIDTFHPVQAGQRVQRLRSVTAPLPAGERGSGQGTVVGFRERAAIVEPFSVIYLEVPQGSALSPGAEVRLVRTEVEDERELPEIEIGRVRVLDVGTSAATALVTALARSDLRVGDRYRSVPVDEP